MTLGLFNWRHDLLSYRFKQRLAGWILLLICASPLTCLSETDASSNSSIRESRNLFARDRVPELPKGAPIYPEDTIGELPIYGGNGMWTFENAGLSFSTGTADSVPIAEILMTLWDEGNLAAVQNIRAALRPNRSRGWSGEPCKGDHLYARNRAIRTIDDCLTIDAVAISVGGKQQTLLSFAVTESGTDGKLYMSTLLISAAYLGFSNSLVIDWNKNTIQTDAAKSVLFPKLIALGEKYQDAAASVLVWNRPKDPFKPVPRLSELKAQAPIKAVSKAQPKTNTHPGVSYVFCESSGSMIIEGQEQCAQK